MSANNYFSSINWCWKSMFSVSIDKYMEMYVTCFPDILKKSICSKTFYNNRYFFVSEIFLKRRFVDCESSQTNIK